MNTSKIFGTGQITLPHKWRKRVNAKHVIIEEVPQGLLIRPLVPTLYYEPNEATFGLNFPTGIEAGKLAADLKKVNERLS